MYMSDLIEALRTDPAISPARLHPRREGDRVKPSAGPPAGASALFQMWKRAVQSARDCIEIPMLIRTPVCILYLFAYISFNGLFCSNIIVVSA